MKDGSFQVLSEGGIKKEELSSLAVRAAAAPVLITHVGMTGSAAAGIAGFQGGRAGFPVMAGAVQVLLATSAGVQGRGFSLVVRCDRIVVCWLCLFWHLFTNRTVAAR